MSLTQRVLAALLASLLIAIGAVALSGGGSSRGAGPGSGGSSALRGPLLPPDLRAPDFTLSDPAGRRVTLSAYRGRVVVVTFIHSLCRGICPLMVEQIKGALDDLPRGGRDVGAIGISVAPAEDTPAHRLAFLRRHGLVRRLIYVSGPRRVLERVWHAFAIAPQTRGEDHSAFVLLVDRRGIERVGFPVSDLTPEDLAHDIRVLEAERA